MSDTYFDPKTPEEAAMAACCANSIANTQQALQDALNEPLRPGNNSAAYREQKICRLRNKALLAEVNARLAVESCRWVQDQGAGHTGWYGHHNAWTPTVPPQNIDWRACEHLAADHLRALGFKDAAVTQAAGDEGIDARAQVAVAQVKHQKTPVGRPALQNLVGAAGPTPRGGPRPLRFFYSTSGYAQTAVNYAGKNDVYLYVINPADGRVSRVPEVPLL
ncbi:restriction endonuclease [Streptomyces sp. NPDC047197]